MDAFTYAIKRFIHECKYERIIKFKRAIIQKLDKTGLDYEKDRQNNDINSNRTQNGT